MMKIVYNLILLICVFIFCWFTGEVTVRIFYSKLSNYNTEMWRYASELKQPLHYLRLPFHHFPDKAGFYYGVDIKTNSLGLRDNEYSLNKPENKKRIIFLGDSFTLGWGVPFNNIYSKRLEKMLNGESNSYEIINMGIGNYNSTMEVELFKLKGLQLNPDLVILMYFINDTEPIPQISKISYSIMRHSYFFAFLYDRYLRFKVFFDKTFNWKDYYKNLYSENSKSLSMNRDSVKGLISLCKEKNIKLMIVNIPELHELKNYPFIYATNYIRALADEADIPFLDLLPSFIDHKPESLWVSSEDSHANSQANSIIAQSIYKKILSEKLI